MSSQDKPSHRSTSTRRKVLAAMGGASALSVAGCVGGGDDGSGDDGSGDDGGSMDDGSGDDGGSSTASAEFVATAGANPGTFDPSIIADATSASTVGTMCYEYLAAPLFDLSEFRGELATDWELVDDTTIRFQIREGVQFHTGDELVAEDVAFSIERVSGTTNDAAVAWISETEVLGDYEIEIRSEEPRAPYLTDLTEVPILPRNQDGISTSPSEDDFAFDQQSIGTGPFTLEEFSAEDRVVLEPFEDYWYDGDDYPGTAPWDQVTFRVVTEQVTQEEAMAAGEVDMIDNPAPFELQQWEGQNGDVVTGEGVGFDFITYPVTQSPYDNADFRRGMTRLIPRPAVIEAVFANNATQLGGPISPGLGAYWDPEHEQELIDEFVGRNVEAAEQLLDSAFEEEDVEKPFEVAFITNVNRTRERWMEIVQQTMNETEYFEAELDVRAFDDLVPFLLDPEGAAASTDVVGIGWTGGSDPNGHVQELLSSDAHVPDGFNWNLYENDEVDQLINEGQTTLDVDERSEIYKDLQRVLAEDVPFASMWTADVIDIVGPDSLESVDQWSPHPNASFRYNTLYKPHLDEVAFPPEQ